MKDIITYILTGPRIDVAIFAITGVVFAIIICIVVKVWRDSANRARLRRYAKSGKFTIMKP